MIAPRGLLYRVASGGRSPDLEESIVQHLRVLLNTRRGDAASAPELGTLDFSDVVHALPGAVQALLQSIRATIAQHEPRLKNVNVRHVADPGELALRFEISAQLARPGAARALRLTTTVRPGGRVDVAE
jgi:type VI secretion system protein